MQTYLKGANFNGYNGSHFWISLYRDISQDTATAISTINYYLYAGSRDGYSGSGSSSPAYINGSQVGSITSIGVNSSTLVGTKTVQVQHDAYGKATAAYSASLNTNWGGVGSASLSGTLVLPDIPRASSVAATNAVVGGSTTININRAIEDFTHTLEYSFDGLTGTIASNVDTSYSWIIPTTFYQKLTNTDYTVGKTCTITCTTYNGEDLIGTSTTTINITVDATSSDVKPTVDATITLDSTTNNLTGATNRIIKGMTDATIAITATAKNGSSIASKLVTCGDGKSLTADGTLNDVESGDFVITAVDSRGVANSTTKTLTLVEYTSLSLNPTFYRTSPTNNTIALTFSGNYFNDKFGTASSTANTLNVKYRYKLSTSSTWSSYANLSTTLNGNTYSNGSNPITLGTNFDYTKEYDFEIVATDRIGSITRTAKVAEGIPIFDWGKTDFQFHVPIKQSSGNEVLDYTTTSGDNIVFKNKYLDTSGIKHGNETFDDIIGAKISSYNLVTDGAEVKVGYQVDGKDVYAKRYTLSSLSSNTKINHGLTNFELIDIDVMTYANGTYRKLNYTTNVYYIIDVSSTQIQLYSNGSLSGTGKITLYYIKTS